MKTNIIFHFLIFLMGFVLQPTHMFGQLNPIWNHTNNPTASDDQATSVTVQDNSVYVAGYDYTPGNAGWRLEKRESSSGSLVSAFGSSGVVLSDPTNSDDLAYGIASDQSGIYITGIEGRCLGCDSKWHIEKRDLITGSLIWSQISNPSTNPDGSYAVAVDTSGIYVVGTVGISFLNWAWRVEKRSLTTGILIWGHTIDISPLGDTPYSVDVDSNGVYVVGYDNATGNAEWRMEKRDLVTGNLIWVQTNNASSGEDVALSVSIDSSNIYVSGYDYSLGNSQWRIEKRNTTTGSLVNTFGSSGVVINNLSSGDDHAKAIKAENSGIYITGFDQSLGSSQWYIEKRNKATGGLICSNASSTAVNFEIANGIAIDSSGVYIVGSSDLSAGNIELKMGKYSLCGISTKVESIDKSLFVKIYPNPASNFLNIAVEEDDSYPLQIYNSLGALVYDFMINKFAEINIGNLPNGIFFIRIGNNAQYIFIKES